MYTLTFHDMTTSIGVPSGVSAAMGVVGLALRSVTATGAVGKSINMLNIYNTLTVKSDGPGIRCKIISRQIHTNWYHCKAIINCIAYVGKDN